MKSTYEIKLEALQKDLETEKAERKKLEDQLRMARHWRIFWKNGRGRLILEPRPNENPTKTRQSKLID